jgi:glycine/D-amino acid oxidase-like deaminating enzyme
MKTIVLGAGIVGVTTAYQLAKAGHEVTVIDRQPGPALETSFANAGEVSFGYCSPWAAPGIPAKAIRWLFMKHAPLILRPRVDVAMLSWLVKMLSNCTSTRYAVNKSRMLRLADYSRTSLAALREETSIAYDERMQGTLQLFREQAQLDACAKDVKALAADGGRVRGVVTASETLSADAVVVALGSFYGLFLKRYGIKLPVYPVKGYSLTIPIIDSSRAPESTVMDETYKIAITRLGDRIRVGGMAEISGYTNDLGLARRRTLEYRVTDLFPGGDATKELFWSGLRPMTPDGTPIIGPTRLAGLYLNTGHGTLGRTMSSGSARMIADIVSGRKPEIDAADLALARYGSART